MSDLDLTPEEKAQILGQRISNLKARRYDTLVTIELTEALPNNDPNKEAALRQGQADVREIERVLAQLNDMLDEQSSTNGNRQQRRAAARRSSTKRDTKASTNGKGKPKLSDVSAS